jgi:predicted AAA+ superfamily ATPase
MDDCKKLYARSMRPALATALTDTPVVALLGPRQCGKSTLVKTFAPEFTYISLDDEAVLATARHDPTGFVAGLPHQTIIDEVQRAPGILRAIKLVVDQKRRPGHFLLTGSANLLLLPQLGDSLAGRMEIVGLHPLTESEKERTAGGLLKTFLAGALRPEIRGTGGDGLELPARIVAGGYPEPLSRAPERARLWYRNYVRALMERDVQELARVNDVGAVARLLELLTLRTGELLNVNNISKDLGLQRDTIDKYLGILEKLFLVRRLPAWHRNEATRLVKAPKIHLVDSGLAAVLSSLSVEDWALRRDRFGHLLESFVVQQVIAQAGWTNPDLRCWHYRDKDQVEVDLVLTIGRKTWGIEVKSSASVNESDGHGLRRLAEQCGRDFQGGMLVYTGGSILPMEDKRIWAVPIRDFWSL